MACVPLEYNRIILNFKQKVIQGYNKNEEELRINQMEFCKSIIAIAKSQ
jgi:hypothetical protein